MLQTYDQTLKAKETYSYGQGRLSYLNHETNKHYQYLTSQSGSVTGLTQDGAAVASTSYSLYGSTKASTDETGNPFAYNGEARDLTGLDYLRARYYDSTAGTFLTEDAYQGELADPLSQNRYSYVGNNPVNYIDPSGHKMVLLDGGGGKRKAKAYAPSKPRINPQQQRYYSQTQVQTRNGGSISLAQYTHNRIQSSPTYKAPQSYYDAFGSRAATYQGSSSSEASTSSYGGGASYRPTPPSSSYSYASVHRNVAIQTVTDQWATAKRSGQSVYNWGNSRTREGKNISRNWSKALEKTIRHVCDPKTTKARDGGVHPTLGGVASWGNLSGASSSPQVNRLTPPAPTPSRKKLTTKDLARVVISANQGNSAALQTLANQAHYAPAYQGSPEEGAKAAALIAGAAVGYVTKKPELGISTYGGVRAGLTSLVRGEQSGTALGKAAVGAGSGYLIGRLGAKIGAQSLIGSSAVDGLGETALDVLVDGMNGDKITPDKVIANALSNIGGNIALGGLFRGLGKIVPSVPKSRLYSIDELDKLLRTDNFSDHAIEHIFLGNINGRGKATGYHYDMIEGSPGRLVPDTITTPNAQNIYSGVAEIDGIIKTGNGGYSTMFPDHMSPQQIVDAINEVYRQKYNPLNQASRQILSGRTSQGLMVQVIVNPQGKIITAYPIME